MAQSYKTLYSAGKLDVADGSGNLSKTKVISAATTLVAGDSGKVFFLSAAGGVTVTLPPVATAGAGWNAKFVLATQPNAGVNTIITEDAASDTNVIVGSFATAAVTAGIVQKSSSSGVTFINFIANLANKGDSLDLVGDATNWYILNGQHGANVAITLT